MKVSRSVSACFVLNLQTIYTSFRNKCQFSLSVPLLGKLQIHTNKKCNVHIVVHKRGFQGLPGYICFNLSGYTFIIKQQLELTSQGFLSNEFELFRVIVAAFSFDCNGFLSLRLH